MFFSPGRRIFYSGKTLALNLNLTAKERRTLNKIENNNSTVTKEAPVHSLKDSKTLKYVVLAVWALAVIFMLLHQDSISMESIMAFSQENWLIIALMIISLFALKGIVFMIYAGLLFAASGILLPLPLAILVNIIGVTVMVTIPFCLTRFIGGNAADAIREKYPKVASLLMRRGESDLLFTLILRIIKVIPVEPLSIYLSAIGVRYVPFVLGSVLGMLPSCILFPIMGTNVGNIHSPEFLIAAGMELAFMAVSLIGMAIYRKRRPQAA